MMRRRKVKQKRIDKKEQKVKVGPTLMHFFASKFTLVYSSNLNPALPPRPFTAHPHPPPLQAKQVRAQFDKSCALVEKASAKLKAKTAFITFGSEEGYERCARAYKGSYWRAICGQPRRLRFPKVI